MVIADSVADTFSWKHCAKTNGKANEITTVASVFPCYCVITFTMFTTSVRILSQNVAVVASALAHRCIPQNDRPQLRQQAGSATSPNTFPSVLCPRPGVMQRGRILVLHGFAFVPKPKPENHTFQFSTHKFGGNIFQEHPHIINANVFTKQSTVRNMTEEAQQSNTNCTAASTPPK